MGKNPNENGNPPKKCDSTPDAHISSKKRNLKELDEPGQSKRGSHDEYQENTTSCDEAMSTHHECSDITKGVEKASGYIRKGKVIETNFSTSSKERREFELKGTENTFDQDIAFNHALGTIAPAHLTNTELENISRLRAKHSFFCTLFSTLEMDLLALLLLKNENRTFKPGKIIKKEFIWDEREKLVHRITRNNFMVKMGTFYMKMDFKNVLKIIHERIDIIQKFINENK